jgi:hypothetical protein
MRPIINAVESALGQSRSSRGSPVTSGGSPMNRHSREPWTCLKGARTGSRQIIRFDSRHAIFDALIILRGAVSLGSFKNENNSVHMDSNTSGIK